MPFLEGDSGHEDGDPCVLGRTTEASDCLDSPLFSENPLWEECFLEEDDDWTDREGVEPTSSLYARLCFRSRDSLLVRYRGQRSRICVVEDLSGGRCTVAVLFVFDDDARRDDCCDFLRTALRVPADAWLLTGGEPSLLLFLSVDWPLEGPCWTREVDHELERWLGCPRSRGGRTHPVLSLASEIRYEVVDESVRGAWLCDREDVLRDCQWETIRS